MRRPARTGILHGWHHRTSPRKSEEDGRGGLAKAKVERQKQKAKTQRDSVEELLITSAMDIRQRAFEFAIRIVKLCKFLEKHSEVSRSLVHQLSNAGTSVGANLEEAQAAQSRRDFIHKNAIALKEARESNYWLRLILATENFDVAVRLGVEELADESLQIAKIVGKIIVNTKKSS